VFRDLGPAMPMASPLLRGAIIVCAMASVSILNDYE
jgi:hypothetical protein